MKPFRNPLRRWCIVIDTHPSDPTKDRIVWGRVRDHQASFGTAAVTYYSTRAEARWQWLLIMLHRVEQGWPIDPPPKQPFIVPCDDPKCNKCHCASCRHDMHAVRLR